LDTFFPLFYQARQHNKYSKKNQYTKVLPKNKLAKFIM